MAQKQMKKNTIKATANSNNQDFTKGDYVVYPAHGVGLIEGVETQTIAGMEVRLYAISFEKDRMRLKIPVMKAKNAGLRKLSSNDRLRDALSTLQGRSRIRRTMWSRRAQEYETKINSGDPIAIAEVLRDLKRSNDDTEQSYSERQIYQSALERLAREVAAIKNIDEIKATSQLEDMMRKTATARISLASLPSNANEKAKPELKAVLLAPVSGKKTMAASKTNAEKKPAAKKAPAKKPAAKKAVTKKPSAKKTMSAKKMGKSKPSAKVSRILTKAKSTKAAVVKKKLIKKAA